MSQENKSLIRRFYTQLWNEGNMDLIDEVVAEDFVAYNQPEELPQGREGFKQFARMYLNAFPDTEWEVEDLIAEGDKVVMRWTARATHKGELMGIPPTNKRVEVTGIGIMRLSGGKIIEEWGEFDRAGMLQQLGAIPEPEED